MPGSSFKSDNLLMNPDYEINIQAHVQIACIS